MKQSLKHIETKPEIRYRGFCSYPILESHWQKRLSFCYEILYTDRIATRLSLFRHSYIWKKKLKLRQYLFHRQVGITMCFGADIFCHTESE